MTLEQLNQQYRDTFGSDRGKEVLADILNDCGYFSLEDMKDPADIARLNVARRILGKCGIWEPVNMIEIVDTTVKERTVKGFLTKLFRLPIPDRTNKE